MTDPARTTADPDHPTAASARQLWAHGCRVASVVMVGWLVFDYLRDPAWPTPDWLLMVAFFAFMAFGQALELLRRLAPFSALLVMYEAFRGLAPNINGRVEFNWMIDADTWLTGSDRLPTEWLQHWLWTGEPRWYDFVYYAAYMAHFVFPALIVVLAWKLRSDREHRLVVRSYVLLTTAGFITYVAFPAAPPWMASRLGHMPEVTRVSDHVYGAMGLAESTTLWRQIAPNPVAAVPSMHAGYAVLFVILVVAMFGWRWGALAMIYPFIILVGTVYAAEHYAVDELLGAGFAIVAFWLVAVLQARSDRTSVFYQSQQLVANRPISNG